MGGRSTGVAEAEDVISVLTMGDGAFFDQCVNLGHSTVLNMRRMLQAATAPQAVMDGLSHFSCSQCDALTAPKIPREVAVPQTVVPLRYLAMDVRCLPGWEECVRIKSVNLLDETSCNTSFLSSRPRRRRYT